MPLLTAPQVAQAGPPVARAAPMAASSMPVTGTGYALPLETQPPHALAKAPPGPSPATGVERVEAGPLARTKAPPEGGPPERTTKAPPGPSPAGVEAGPLAGRKAPPGPSPVTGVERVEAGPLARTKAPPEGGPPERTTKAPPGPSPAGVEAGLLAGRKAPPGPSPVTGVERVEAGPLARTKAPPEGGPPERTTKAPPGPSPAAVQAAAEEPARGRFRGKRHTKAPPPEALPKCEASEGVTNRWPKAAPYYQQSQVQSLVSRF